MPLIGKIARLPAALRDELNTRLQDGEPGPSLLAWLNGLPAVQSVLAAQFGGAVVTKQNLSEWRRGGFLAWCRTQEARAWLEGMRAEDAALRDDKDCAPASGLLAATLAIALGRCLEQLAAPAPGPAADPARLLAVATAITRLRRCDLAAERTRIADERWRLEVLEAENKARRELAVARRDATRRIQAAQGQVDQSTLDALLARVNGLTPPGSSATTSAPAAASPPPPASPPPASPQSVSQSVPQSVSQPVPPAPIFPSFVEESPSQSSLVQDKNSFPHPGPPFMGAGPA